MTETEAIFATVQSYYRDKVQTYGPTPKGVDWNSQESQDLRFRQLLKVIDSKDSGTINDFGCGYGALAKFLRARGYGLDYRGFDICPAMIDLAKTELAGVREVQLITELSKLSSADYTVASGIFNVRLGTAAATWNKYIRDTLQQIAALSVKGFAFNLLTSYSDPDRMRTDLYYADPCEFFDYCKTSFSKDVALLHDYGLYEFTILVRLSL